jgi:hypothetical protein
VCIYITVLLGIRRFLPFSYWIIPKPCNEPQKEDSRTTIGPRDARLSAAGLTRSSSLIAIYICCLIPFWLPESHLILFVWNSYGSLVAISTCVFCLEPFRSQCSKLCLLSGSVPFSMLSGIVPAPLLQFLLSTRTTLRDFLKLLHSKET